MGNTQPYIAEKQEEIRVLKAKLDLLRADVLRVACK